MKTRVHPSRRAFFERGPRGGAPLGNRDLVAFPGASRRFLRAPLEATQDAPDARGTIRHPKVTLNEGRNAPQSPQLIVIAMGPGARAEEVQQALTLLRSQVWCTARMPCGGEARLTLVHPYIPPATDRTRRRLH